MLTLETGVGAVAGIRVYAVIALAIVQAGLGLAVVDVRLAVEARETRCADAGVSGGGDKYKEFLI